MPVIDRIELYFLRTPLPDPVRPSWMPGADPQDMPLVRDGLLRDLPTGCDVVWRRRGQYPCGRPGGASLAPELLAPAVTPQNAGAGI